MTEDTLVQFKKELDCFVVIVSLNMASGALAMAFAMMYIVISIQNLPVWQVPGLLRIPVAILFMLCFGFGLNWVLSSGRILRGVKSVRREYRNRIGTVSEETLTCWIVRILAHYRENRSGIRWMVPVSIIGGCAFLALGISNFIQGIGDIYGGGGAFALIAAVINLTIGSVSIPSALYFRRYSASWDERLKTAACSEDTLKHALERQ
jgi:hypothetical protein